MEQRNSGAGRKEKMTRWGRSVRGGTGERERAGRWGQARREGDADCGASWAEGALTRESGPG